MADSDDDDLTFAKDYRPTEEGMVISAKDADFRSFLCDSGAAEEMIRLLVGLAESSNPPADPVAFLRAKFDAEDMPDMVVGKVREDIPALLRENDARTQQVAQLTAQVDEAVAKLEEREAAAHAVLVDQLIGGGAYASDATEGALDLAKLYAAVLARFPAPPEPAEGEEEAEPPPPQPWAAEGAVSPEGTLTSDALKAWAKDAFGYGAALLASHAESGLSLQLLVSAASGDEATEVDGPKAVGLYEAVAMLATYTEEANAPPPEEE